MATYRKYLGSISRTLPTTGIGDTGAGTRDDTKREAPERPKVAPLPAHLRAERQAEAQETVDTTEVEGAGGGEDETLQDASGGDESAQGSDDTAETGSDGSEDTGDASSDDEPTPEEELVAEVEAEAAEQVDGSVGDILAWVHDVDDSETLKRRAQAILDLEGEDGRKTLVPELKALLADDTDEE